MIPNINLLPKTDRRHAESKLVYILIGVIAILVLAIMLWQYFSARSSLADLMTEEVALQQEVATLQLEYDTYLASQKGGSLEESVTFVERVSYEVSPLIDETQGLLEGNTYLRSYSFSESAVTIAVDFETLANIAGYVSALENSSFFTDAQLSNVSNFELSPASSSEEETDETEKFNEVPRYSTNITLQIDQTYLANRGAQ